MSRHCSSALIHFEAVSRGCHLNYVLIFNRPHGIAFSVKAGGAFPRLEDDELGRSSLLRRIRAIVIVFEANEQTTLLRRHTIGNEDIWIC
ncbi:hypothetical protein H9L39_10618 [Fusarium oxysporum f. sp. albedinis]|nr:hypothetical protein H9L39_10618 [Fusarium oxysporum f. sp. albedinis]